MGRATTIEEISATAPPKPPPVRDQRRRIKLRRPLKIETTEPRKDNTTMLFSRLLHMDLRAKPHQVSEVMETTAFTPASRFRRLIGDVLGRVFGRDALLPLGLGLLAGLLLGLSF